MPELHHPKVLVEVSTNIKAERQLRLSAKMALNYIELLVSTNIKAERQLRLEHVRFLARRIVEKYQPTSKPKGN